MVITNQALHENTKVRGPGVEASLEYTLVVVGLYKLMMPPISKSQLKNYSTGFCKLDANCKINAELFGKLKQLESSQNNYKLEASIIRGFSILHLQTDNQLAKTCVLTEICEVKTG